MPATLEDIKNKYGQSVYPLYKELSYEPYVENDSGGYDGVVLYNELEDKVRCEECGEWFFGLYGHIKVHSLSIEQYKEKYKILKKTPLQSKNASLLMSKAQEEREPIIPLGRPFERDNRFSKVNAVKGGVASGKARSKTNYLNNFNLCEAQVESRLLIAAKRLNVDKLEDISSHQLNSVDPNLVSFLRRKYGGWEQCSKELGLKYVGIRDKYEDAELLGKIRDFYDENGCVPAKNDLTNYGLPSGSTYRKHFGSWRRTLIMAGVVAQRKSAGLSSQRSGYHNSSTPQL